MIPVLSPAHLQFLPLCPSNNRMCIETTIMGRNLKPKPLWMLTLGITSQSQQCVWKGGEIHDVNVSWKLAHLFQGLHEWFVPALQAREPSRPTSLLLSSKSGEDQEWSRNPDPPPCPDSRWQPQQQKEEGVGVSSPFLEWRTRDSLRLSCQRQACAKSPTRLHGLQREPRVLLLLKTRCLSQWEAENSKELECNPTLLVLLSWIPPGIFSRMRLAPLHHS